MASTVVGIVMESDFPIIVAGVSSLLMRMIISRHKLGAVIATGHRIS